MIGFGLSIFGLCVVALCVLDFLLAAAAFRKRTQSGRYLGLTSIFAALSAVFHYVRQLMESTFAYSIFSSCYFVSMNYMLVFMAIFVRIYTQGRITKKGRVSFMVLFVLICIDSIIVFVNPFYDIVVTFVEVGAGSNIYISHPLYYSHLGLSYVFVVLAMLNLLYKIFESPREYKLQYIYSATGVFFIMLVNVLYRTIPALDNHNYADITLPCYSFCVCIFYWSCYRYSTHGMLNYFKHSILENVEQAIVLFDRDDKVIMRNGHASNALPGVDLGEPLWKFLLECEIPSVDSYVNGGYSFQCVISKNGEETPFRCDYRLLKNKKDKVIGKLFIFTNTILETDILTGFHNLDAFEIFVRESDVHLDNERVSVAVCDINGLSLINASRGRSAGDASLKNLASKIREIFPKDSYFVRGEDALLIVVSFSLTEGQTKGLIEKVKQSVAEDLVTAVGIGARNPEGILGAIKSASRALHQKKLLDQKSLHSSALSSLIRALQECDGDTEAHVRRTQLMGAELGKRMGFTDVQQSDLSLLCLFHDIGKIGIPLEILNKPSKLNGDEWSVMMTHVEKGFQIANSSPELCGIADMIRHHHERWDGKGYPDGLSRETIPLLSRVIAVVDSYDAMVSNRVYRKALTQVAAFDELIRCTGSQFDPTIVSEFIHMIEDNPTLGVSESVESADDGLEKISMDDLELPVESRFRNCVHIVNFVNYTIDANTFRILSVNKAFEEFSGYSMEDVEKLGLCQKDFLPEEDRIEFLRLANECFAKTSLAYLEHRFVCKDGRVVYVLDSGRKFYDAATKTSKIEVTVIDSSNTYIVQQVMETQQDKADQQLRYWENTFRKDSLTGLLCRSAFQSDVEQKLLEGNEKVMLLMLDVDKFKEFNDTYGHHAGDEFLVLVAQALSNSLRSDDLSCRMGGDEFAAALFFKKDCTEEFMSKRAQQIFDKINMTMVSATHGTTLSMGAVIADENKNTFNKIYEASDKALYKSKENGRGRMSLD